MASPIRNYAVAQGQLAAGGVRSLYTVPANHALILKSLGARNVGGVTTVVTVYITAASNTSTIVVISASLTNGQSVIWSGWTVLNASDLIQMDCANSATQYWAAGALLPYSGPVTGVTEATTLEQLQPEPTPAPLPVIEGPFPPTIYLPSPEYPAYVSASAVESRAASGRRAKRDRDP